MDQKITALDLLVALNKAHSKDSGWVFLGELKEGKGEGFGTDQRIDAWAIQCHKHKAVDNLMRAFEIKITRADFLSEIRNPDKRAFAYSVSHEFYFVAPTGIIPPATLSPDDGLIEYNPETKAMKIVKIPTVRGLNPARWSFVALALRAAAMNQQGITST
jgi:hypothetical protein